MQEHDIADGGLRPAQFRPRTVRRSGVEPGWAEHVGGGAISPLFVQRNAGRSFNTTIPAQRPVPDRNRGSVRGSVRFTRFPTVPRVSPRQSSACSPYGCPKPASTAKPHHEVRRSLNAVLLGAMAPEFAAVAERRNLRRLLRANDFAGVEGLFRAFLAGIPNEWYTRIGMEEYEAHYASVFHSHFAAAGMDVRAEEGSARGRADMALRFNGRVYLLGFKVVDQGPEGTALAELKARGHADKYRDPGLPVHLIGVEFSREERNIVAFPVEAA